MECEALTRLLAELANAVQPEDTGRTLLHALESRITGSGHAVLARADREVQVLAGSGSCASLASSSGRAVAGADDQGAAGTLDATTAGDQLDLPGVSKLGGSVAIIPLKAGGRRVGELLVHEPSDGASLENPELQPLLHAAALAVDGATSHERCAAAEAESERTLERVGYLIRGVSHDLKNPLGAIDGYVQLLEAGVRGDLEPAQLEYTGRISASVRHMLDILRDLLDLARSDTGALTLDLQPLPTAGVLREAVLAARGNAEKFGLQVDAAIPERLPPIFTDPGRLRQVFDNLFQLFLQSVPEGQSVRILAETREDGDSHSEINVSIAAPAAVLSQAQENPLLFDGFFRIDLQPGREAGTGLELALARRLARSLGGEVSLSSEGDEATLVVHIPVAEAPDVR